MYNDIAYLCSETVTQDDAGNIERALSKKEVDVKPESVGMREFYQASTAGLKADLRLIIPDEYDYDGEKIVEYNGGLYDVTRSYINRGRVELTLTARIGRKGAE